MFVKLLIISLFFSKRDYHSLKKVKNTLIRQRVCIIMVLL